MHRIKDISKAQISFISSLKQKKYRAIENLFVAEGDKIVKEILLAKVEIKYVVALPEWINENISFLKSINVEVLKINQIGMRKISSLSTPSPVLIVVSKFSDTKIKYNKNDVYLALDDVRDPGNLGTIIRICDWFGIENIICSETCTDLYLPKTIQACMGSFLRVNLYYTDLYSEIVDYKKDTGNLVYGTFLDGENIYDSQLKKGALIVMGNESNGISDNIKSLIDYKLLIPSFSKKQNHGESLNVSIATAICCSEFFRES